MTQYVYRANELAEESERRAELIPGAQWRVETPHLHGVPLLAADVHEDGVEMRAAFYIRDDDDPVESECYNRMTEWKSMLGGLDALANDVQSVRLPDGIGRVSISWARVYFLEEGYLSEARGRHFRAARFFAVLGEALGVCGLARESTRILSLYANAYARQFQKERANEESARHLPEALSR